MFITRRKKENKRILIIVKRREQQYCYHHDDEHIDPPSNSTTVSSGLKNSASFVVDMLNNLGHTAELVEVVDNNCIDKEVTKFKPDIVIIEALWVVPTKFDVLKNLHPNVKWIVRLHSDIPFIANEGIAMEWIFGYVQRNVYVGVNSSRINCELKQLVKDKSSLILYLPNFYPLLNKPVYPKPRRNPNIIDIGCFGAIRPMKNQLLQAVAAIIFANDKGLKLRFHINGSRCETKGDNVLKNLRALFDNSLQHELVEHNWLDHEEFLKLMATMDISMQCSLSETFNIVSCDAVSQNVPIVVSPEISWASDICIAKATDSEDIVNTLKMVWSLRRLVVHKLNYFNLKSFDNESIEIWKQNMKI